MTPNFDAESAALPAMPRRPAPAEARSPATARRIPRPAPVMMTTCPSSSPAIHAPPIARCAWTLGAALLPGSRPPRVVIGDALGPDAQLFTQLVLDRRRPLG